MSFKLRTFFDALSKQPSQEEFDLFLEQKRKEFLTLEPFANNLSAMLKNRGGWDAEEDNNKIFAYRTRAYKILKIEKSQFQRSVAPLSEIDTYAEQILLKEPKKNISLSSRKQAIESAVKNYELYLQHMKTSWKKLNIVAEPT